MTDIYLVRHGQASFGKANYDKLSELGAQQAYWLGDYFRHRDIEFDSVFMGDMVRHRETQEGIAAGIASSNHVLPQSNVDSGLNEFNFQAVAKAYLHRYPEQQVPEGAPSSEYYRLLKKAMLAWSQDALDHAHLDETWRAFEDRVSAVLKQLQQLDAKRVLVVSSGGAIAMMLKQILGYDDATVINMNLQIRNASFSQCYANAKGFHLNNFNSVPHLDVTDRLHAITYS
ncbi:histidine phosphatase family protein [Alteromonas gracilis]|uniref:histidine phosphatase family protein n=1 Tax=Alteromonas gracilis TaxID=1479524 RepID=UPI0030D2AC2B